MCCEWKDVVAQEGESNEKREIGVDCRIEPYLHVTWFP